MNDLTLSFQDETIMKLLHYFITEKGYNPVVLHGVKDEIWLEKMDGEYKIVKISSKYIHNNEQFDFDLFKTRQILKNIRKKTYSFSLETLVIFLNLGDNVNDDKTIGDTITDVTCVKAKEAKDIAEYPNVLEIFPDINDKLSFNEKGKELFLKITGDINKANESSSKKMDKLFKIDKPIITYGLIAVCMIYFIITLYISNGELTSNSLASAGALVSKDLYNGGFYRFVTSIFMHGSAVHLFVNLYALYVIGPQIENFFGKKRFLMIFLLSGIMGNLLSFVFLKGVSIGASGAIFGLLGALLYFGYYYRVYFGTVIKSQILPLIGLNLLIGFMLPNINNAAHIGGLIGGLLAAMATGVGYNCNPVRKKDGILLYLILGMFLGYLGFIA